MLQWLENTPVALAISGTTWVYFLALASHGLGMAIVVGLSVVIALRILGFPAKVPLGSLRVLLPYLLFGLALNVLSGLALFVADASTLFFNAAFQIKIAMIVVGIALLWRIDAGVLRPAAQARLAGAARDETAMGAVSPRVGFAPSRGAKLLAVAVILVWWFSVVLSGRLIAYLETPF